MGPVSVRLSVTLVYCGQTVGWIKMPLSTEGEPALRQQYQSDEIHVYTVSQKNVPPVACYNFDTHEWILIFFDRNITDKVTNQNTLYYVTLTNLCFCTTWQNGEIRKLHFHTVGLCYTHNAPVRCLPERKSCHL